MVFKIGLRSEIIVNITLLLGAALLFVGFLLLKLTERELVTQRVASVTGAMEIISHALSADFPEEGSDENLMIRAAAILHSGAEGLPVEAWGLADRRLLPFTRPGSKEILPLESADLTRVRFGSGPVMRLQYPPAWLPFGEEPESYVIVTVPLFNRAEFAGALQARFTLNDVRQRVLSAYKLILVYVLLYGTVLVMFGIYLLNRTVVRPVRNLREGTRQVAAGDLEQTLPVEGPREIADLANSFNVMIAALKESRRQAEASIISLREANEDLKRTRDELIRSEKMASVGHLAAGMAHEIGNPLGALVGYLEFLREELPLGREKEILESSLAEAQRIDRLVRDLLEYATSGSVKPELIDPLTVLIEARDILAQQGVLADLHLVDKLPCTLPEVNIVRHKLLQVFVNLILNARDASSRGGMVRLEGGSNGKDVWLSVADEGSGMSPDVLTHIFDPFFTTKAPNKGRGLGLSVCYRVIEEAGGRIEVRSEKEEGSTFTVWLKRADNTDEA